MVPSHTTSEKYVSQHTLAVGYIAVDALVRMVERVAFWQVCVGFGTLAVVGGGVLLL